MSCDQSAWSVAADNYASAMGVVKTTCEALETADALVVQKQEELQAAQQAAAEAATEYEAAKANASTAQTAVGAEAEKLGIVCQCPEEQP